MDDSVKKAAMSIMRVFKRKGLHAGDFIKFTDFGGALRWDAGHMRDEDQREGLRELSEHGLVVETSAGLELTARGEKSLEKL